MSQYRPINEEDRLLLEFSLEGDSYHRDTTSDFFYDPNSVCNVYEDDEGPVLFVRGTKALRLDIQFVDNKDTKRNAAVMLEQFANLAQQAKANGFTEIIFNSNSPLLIRFCKQKFGFVESKGELRKFL